MRSTAEQEADNRRLAAGYGWRLLDSYTEAGENGADQAVSASRYSRKARTGFARLVADLEAGRFGADVLVLREPSRGSRRLSEWARFLELLEERGVSLYVTSHERLYDLSNYRDRMSLHDDGSDSEYESALKPARCRRAAAANAREGRPHGGPTAYGYRRVRGMDGTTRTVEQVVDPDEAEVVREVFDRFTAGDSLYSIGRDLAARGVRSRGGKLFDQHTVRQLLTRRCLWRDGGAGRFPAGEKEPRSRSVGWAGSTRSVLVAFGS